MNIRFASRSINLNSIRKTSNNGHPLLSTPSSKFRRPPKCNPCLAFLNNRADSQMTMSTLANVSFATTLKANNARHVLHKNKQHIRSVANKSITSKLKAPPRKAAVNLTPSSRTFFKNILTQKLANISSDDNDSDDKKKITGIMLNFQQSLTGQPRMVFTFEFVAQEDLDENDEGVSLEILSDGVTPKPPSESISDGLPKLYIHHHAFMKVLGATIDLREDGFTPYLIDREGNEMDPNNT